MKHVIGFFGIIILISLAEATITGQLTKFMSKQLDSIAVRATDPVTMEYGKQVLR